MECRTNTEGQMIPLHLVWTSLSSFDMWFRGLLMPLHAAPGGDRVGRRTTPEPVSAGLLGAWQLIGTIPRRLNALCTIVSHERTACARSPSKFSIRRTDTCDRIRSQLIDACKSCKYPATIYHHPIVLIIDYQALRPHSHRMLKRVDPPLRCRSIP